MRVSFLLFFILPVTIGIAQTKTYRADLQALHVILKKMPSYKAQIRGDRLASYDSLYRSLAEDSVSDPDGYEYFLRLSRLIFPLRDNHIGFYQLPDYNNFKSRQRIDSFTMSKEFLDYPSVNLNTDSLKAVLARKPLDSIEGIYHYGRFYSVGVFKSGQKEYAGVVVDSDINLWKKGQIAIHLYEYAPHLYKAIYGHSKFKNFMLQSVEKFRNASLINSYFYGSYYQGVYSKQPNVIDHTNLPENAPQFEMRNIHDTVQYLLIRTFQRNNSTSKASGLFFDSIRNNLAAPYLILDLRNNEGGAAKETRKYYSLLKKYSRKGRLFILQNNGTISQAEIFLLKLKKLKNVITIGQTTKGMLTYGSNYGRRVRLPSGRFEIYPTDMKGSRHLLQYEDYGIRPDIHLNANIDWIQQVIRIIGKH